MKTLRKLRAAALLACAVVPLAALAHSFNVKGITIDHPFATPTPPGAPTGAVYLSLDNKGKTADKLVAATTPRAKRVELHSMSMSGDVMRMREVDAIEVTPGRRVDMTPGSTTFHLMLVDLGAPLKVGDKFPLTLRFRDAGSVVVEVFVEQPKPAATTHQH